MTIEQLRNSGMIIFEGIVGSQAYGIATPASDIDKKGVFILAAILRRPHVLVMLPQQGEKNQFYPIEGGRQDL